MNAEDLLKLRDKVIVESPFTESELTEPIITRAVEKAYGDLNKYKPRIVKSSARLELPGYTLLRAYYNAFDTASAIPYLEEAGIDLAMIYYYSAPWDWESLSKANEMTRSAFTNLVIAHSCMFMANKRRSAEMNSLPFNIKGDQFYNEAKEKLDGVIDSLINTSVNNL